MTDFVPANLSEISGITSQVSHKNMSISEKTSYQIVSINSGFSIDHIRCCLDARVFEDLTYLYRMRLLPKNKHIASLILFSIPGECEIPFDKSCAGETICDREARVRYWMNKYCTEGKIWIDGEQICSSIPDVLSFVQLLREKGFLSVSTNQIEGEILFLPVSRGIGFLSNHFLADKITFNSQFFLIELSDLESKYDIAGEPFGMLLIKGEIINPPIYERESLLFDGEERSRCQRLGIRDIPVIINGSEFRDSENATFYVRPEAFHTPVQEGTDIAVVGRRIAGFKNGGDLEIPEAGFVIHLDRIYKPEVTEVTYVNNTGYDFGIQVGPLLIDGGKPASDFNDPYFNGNGTAYPPTVYPIDWHRGRAARVGFGMRNGKPVLIWVEGSKPEIYTEGVDSLGFSLAEFTQLAKEEGIDNFINLDGGGSSQIALGSQRMLRISDRYESTGEDFERPVPLGLSIKCHI